MYSQRDEERHIVKYFRGITGSFLDIGAYDGKCFSTTLRLVELGWGGHCIEPSPSIFPALKNRYKDNLKVYCHQLAVADKTEKRLFYDSRGDAVSTLDKDHAKLWEEKGKVHFKEVEVQCLSVHDLFTLVGKGFDFINIDTEGSSFYILQHLPFKELPNLNMICVEYDKQLNKIAALFDIHGFRILHRTAENLIGVR